MRSRNVIQADVRRALDQLGKWFQGHGPAGFDPYDFRARPFYVHLVDLAENHMLARIALRLVEITADVFPSQLRGALGVQPSILPKTQALLAKGYLRLASCGDRDQLELANGCLDWLRSHSVGSTGTLGWGLPFDWRSRVLIPNGTIASTVTVECGEAFWTAYHVTGDTQYLADCEMIARCLYTSLRRQESSSGLCFSYTPVDEFHVHNANLMVADFLIRVGRLTNNRLWVRDGLEAVKYSLSDQLPDGSFEYWGPPDRTFSHIDHYHTGFVIRSLVNLADMGVAGTREALDLCASHYLSHFFTMDGAPKMFPKQVYPLNIHSCAEAILSCQALVRSGFSDAALRLQETLSWTLENMQCTDGHFAYKVDKIIGLKHIQRFAYTRWGQAWMWYALCTVVSGGR